MRKTMLCGLAVATLVLSACGSRVDPDESSSGNLGGGNGSPSTTAAGGGGDDGGGGEGMFGTLPVPCGPGDASANPEQSDVGVTKDKIVIGTIADPGGPRPGLNQGMFDTMSAFADWCNELGGINGREIDLQLLDAKILQYKEQVLIACDSAFALVGGLGVLDDLGAQDAVDCGLPNVPGAAVSPQQADADLTWQPLPNPSDTFSVGAGQWIAEQYPDAIAKAGSVRGNLPVIINQADRQVAAYEQIGFDFVSTQTANVAETNWAPYVLNLKNDGVEYLSPTSTYEELLPMQKSMNEQGFAPTVTELETNFYNQQYPEQAAAQGIDVGNTVLRLTTWPFEEADERPAMAQFLEILEQYSSDYDTDPQQLGVQSMSAALLWATAVKAAGPDLTRERLAEELDKIKAWDGGGLHGETDPGDNIRSTCFIMMKVTAEGFERIYPLPDEDAEVYQAGQGMACPSDSQVDIPEFGGQGAKAAP